MKSRRSGLAEISWNFITSAVSTSTYTTDSAKRRGMSAQSSDDEEAEAVSLFAEPEGFFQAEKEPTFVTHKTVDGKEIHLRLVGSNPLWVGRRLTLLFNYFSLHNRKDVLRSSRISATATAKYSFTGSSPLASRPGHFYLPGAECITTRPRQDGAGTWGRSWSTEHRTGFLIRTAPRAWLTLDQICALHGAKRIVITDYPDAELINNLEHNITANAHLLPNPSEPNIVAEGYLWGASPDKLLSHLPQSSQRFDLLILADILFNHSQHSALLGSVQQTLTHSPDAKALVFFTPYRPWLYEKDMAFFALARAGGFVVEKVLEEVMEKVMFPDDPGDEKLRRTVFGYALRWEERSNGVVELDER